MTKRIISIFAAVLLIFAVMLFSSCGELPDYSSLNVGSSETQAMKDELKSFLLVNGGNRTSQTADGEKDGADGELAAAEYITERLNGITGEASAQIKKFSVSTDYGDTFNSQNIIFQLKADQPKNPERKKIIVGAHYDNSYESVKMKEQVGSGYGGLFTRISSSDDYYSYGTNASGAVESGTSVAVLLQLAEELNANRSSLAFDVDIVFYGMGSLSISGSGKYYDTLNSDSVALAVNIDGLGGTYAYTYFDETETPHGEYVAEKTEELGFASVIRMSTPASVKYGYTMDRLSYTPCEVNNNASTYFGIHNIMSVTSGGEQNYFNVYETEFNGYGVKIGGTSSDTLSNLEDRNGDYAKQLVAVKKLIEELVTDADFKAVLSNSREKTFDYSFMNSQLWMDIIAAGVIILLSVLSILLVKYFEKKYPYNPQPEAEKVAVFGDEFEDNPSGEKNDDINPFDELG